MNIFDYLFDFKYLIPYIEIIAPMSAIIAVCLVLVPFMDKKYVARARYYVWLIIAVRLLMPFDIPLGKESVHIVHAEIPSYAVRRENVIEYNKQMQQIQESENIRDVVINNEIIYENNISEKNNVSDLKKPVLPAFPIINSNTVIAYLWVLGSIGIMLFNFLQYKIAKRGFAKNSIHDENAQLIMNELCKKHHINKKLKVYRCSCITSAMIVGMVKPAIYMPDMDFDGTMMEMMLTHELMHYKRKDIIYKFVLMLACSVHWFNPLVWLMDRQAQKDIEISCDEDVIKGKNQEFKALYSDSILRMVKMGHTKKLAFSTGFSNDKKTLADRFKNIYNSTVKRSGKAVIAGILTLSMLSTALISCAPKEHKEFEIPRQAMDLMEFMLTTYLEDSVLPDILFTTNYNLNAMQGFNYLKHIGAPIDKYIEIYENSVGTGHYEFPFEKAKEIYQFLLAVELDETWDQPPYLYSGSYILNYDYNAFSFYNIGLEYEVISAEQIDENSFIATFSRTIDDVPYNHIWFTMEKQIIDNVPEDLTGYFTAGDEIWRIKDMGTMTFSLNPVPQTIEINSKEEFLAFVEDINTNGHLRQDNTYILNTDIDLTGIDFTPIGRNKKTYHTDIISASFEEGFNCIFDGNGHTISNLTVRYSEGNGMYNGLFSHIGKNGLVINLNIENAVVSPTDDNTSSMKHGTGILAGKNEGYIKNCNVNGSVNGIYLTGGLCGIVNGTVLDCNVDADVYGSDCTGGLSGCIEYSSVVKNCSVKGIVNGIRNTKHHYDTPWLTGGFTGSVYYATIENCHTSALLALDNGGNRNGVFCGHYEETDIINCTYDKSVNNINKVIGNKRSSADNTPNIIEINPI